MMTDSREVLEMKFKSLEEQAETMAKIILAQKQKLSELENEIEKVLRRINHVEQWVGIN